MSGGGRRRVSTKKVIVELRLGRVCKFWVEKDVVGQETAWSYKDGYLLVVLFVLML